jgi:hypothetical protein
VRARRGCAQISSHLSFQSQNGTVSAEDVGHGRVEPVLDGIAKSDVHVTGTLDRDRSECGFHVRQGLAAHALDQPNTARQCAVAADRQVAVLRAQAKLGVSATR